ncbi:hypothetical protein J2Y65_000778 [Aeromonas salmonicida]|uniref:hypothetical protein n=1 Tax=Aeromonas salmonicida TaxID=645 RepID=UPI0028585FB3|nr:hypothetical protein [Aeromonas salmonicida]MDR6994144.1 hypothetical protein [Aeromonas salmonicida]
MDQAGGAEVITFSFTLIEVISLITGVVSIVLGGFAIWLTLHLKKESDSVNKETKDLLMDIRVDAKSVTRGVMSEMEKWGDLGRTVLTSTSDKHLFGGVDGKDTPHSSKSHEKVSTSQVRGDS